MDTKHYSPSYYNRYSYFMVDIIPLKGVSHTMFDHLDELVRKQEDREHAMIVYRAGELIVELKEQLAAAKAELFILNKILCPSCRNNYDTEKGKLHNE